MQYTVLSIEAVHVVDDHLMYATDAVHRLCVLCLARSLSSELELQVDFVVNLVTNLSALFGEQSEPS